MAGSSKKNHGYGTLVHLRDQLALPSRTPGILGINDAGDPSKLSLLGDTPGPTGVNDHAFPGRIVLPGLGTLHNWAVESENHVEASMQVGYWYPAGDKDEVLERAYDFILKHECPNSKPPTYACVPGEASGVTIGVGYDIGQHSEEEFRADWGELDDYKHPYARSGLSLGVKSDFVVGSDLSLTKPLPTLMPPSSKLFSRVDRLAFAARMSHEKSEQYLGSVIEILIPEDLSLKVFKESTLPKFYKLAAHEYWGFQKLPTGVQVAILDLVYNRGTLMKGKAAKNDILDQRWEMRELKSAVLGKDLVWIYFYFESMRRLWANDNDQDAAGLVKRRNDELDLILPYVCNDIQYEAVMQKSGFK